MNLTANQCLNLLWIFHMENNSIELTSDEVAQLEYEVLTRFGSITSPYAERLVARNANQLTEFLRKNGSGTSIFSEE